MQPALIYAGVLAERSEGECCADTGDADWRKRRGGRARGRLGGSRRSRAGDREHYATLSSQSKIRDVLLTRYHNSLYDKRLALIHDLSSWTLYDISKL